MNPFHLLWIVPVSAVVGFLVAAVLCSGSVDDEQMDNCVQCAGRRAELDRVAVTKFREGWEARGKDFAAAEALIEDTRRKA